MIYQPLSYRFCRNLCCPFRRKMKHPCRDTAERNGPKAVFCAEIKRIRITISKFLLQGGGQFSINNRSNDMDHLFRREIICVCQHWNRRWLFIVLPIFHPHPVHLPIAFRTKLMPAKVWMQLSMQVCIGIKHPSICEFAALTMASTASRVISPCQTEITPSFTGISSNVTIPFSRMRSCKYSSCTASTESSILPGIRIFIRERRRCLLPSVSPGVCKSIY